MKSKIFSATLIASALVAGFAATPAMAQNMATPRIDQTQQQISARIQQGLQAGQITPSEARVLYRRDSDIQARIARDRSDGRMTQQEREQVRADQAAFGAEVERMIANNDVVRPGGPRGVDNRQFNISQRIDEAQRANRISPQEANMLRGRERAIADHEARFKSDGVVSQWERRQLQDELSALSNEVDRLAYNRRG